jgi:hypothetical protein
MTNARRNEAIEYCLANSPYLQGMKREEAIANLKQKGDAFIEMLADKLWKDNVGLRG